jgi:DNA polymerase III epsilon subunit-like protein
MALFPLQPPRVYDEPICEWALACAEAEDQRMNAVKRYRRGELTTSEQLEVGLALLAQPDFFIQEHRLLRGAFRPVLVFDTETTGLGPLDVVIQLGYCLLFNGLVVDEYEKIWQSDTPSNPFALKVHKIPNREVLNSPYYPRVELDAFIDLVQRVQAVGGVVVAHNAQFDVRMLDRTAKRNGLSQFSVPNVFCTATHLKRVPVMERGPTCKNGDVYKFLGGPPLRLHRALNDAKATAFVYEEGLSRKWW